MIEKYRRWSSYTPEEQGVMIAYASVYGNTANAADILAGQLSERGIRTVVYDVSVTPSSDIVAAAFRWSHLVFASTTYNAGIFISMEEVLRDLAAHNLSRRTLAFIENGSDVEEALDGLRDGNYMVFSNCNDMTDVVYQYIEETGLLNDVPETLRNYFDYEAYGRDMSFEGTFIFTDSGNCIELF